MTKYIYINQREKVHSFTRLPNFLFEAPSYKKISNDAKVLYAYIFRRTDLSERSGWVDVNGRIYLYYPIDEVMELLYCGRQKIIDVLRELARVGLIEIIGKGVVNQILFIREYMKVTQENKLRKRVQKSYLQSFLSIVLSVEI